jgi:2-hydroxy fatty acid dioxygenase
MASVLPIPDFIPTYQYKVNEYLLFKLNWPAILAGVYLAYYYMLEPVAAVSRVLQVVLHKVIDDCLRLSSCIHHRWSFHF